MIFLRTALPFLVVTVTWLPVAQSIDYSPCAYYVTPGNARQISCERDAASQVLEAFRRNGNFADIDEVYLWFIDDLTDDDLAEILNIVASSASHQVSRISLSFLPKLEKIPEALPQFTGLTEFYFQYNEGIKILPSGSMTFSSDNLTNVHCQDNFNLEVIESGAFRGNFNDTNIYLSGNHLEKFDEAVYEPLLSDSTAIIWAFSNKFECYSCSFAWLVWDNRQYLDRVNANCYDQYGAEEDIQMIDILKLEDC